jgi:hypothetical protein
MEFAENDSVALWPCIHRFHVECSTGWIETSANPLKPFAAHSVAHRCARTQTTSVNFLNLSLALQVNIFARQKSKDTEHDTVNEGWGR